MASGIHPCDRRSEGQVKVCRPRAIQKTLGKPEFEEPYYLSDSDEELPHLQCFYDKVTINYTPKYHDVAPRVESIFGSQLELNQSLYLQVGSKLTRDHELFEADIEGSTNQERSMKGWREFRAVEGAARVDRDGIIQEIRLGRNSSPG